MAHTLPLHLHWLAPLAAFVMATTMIIFRLRAANRPVNVQKILLPPLGMSTGFLMFVYPPTHIPWSWALIAFLTGSLLFSVPLIRATAFHMVDGKVYVKRSKALVWILLSLFSIRILLHSWIEQHIDVFQTASVFFILAFGMLLPWRLAMYFQYRKFMKEHQRKTATS
ncbi:CcdC family protein [Staphylospora marina]|uniref:CcdC family protein n=1 Tax=Staphylospora marina TaxID=2490858 RepID=UPI000F5BE13F|nr:cytochrome c biogenesis protein CcdC [Staphylospora marina]